MGNTCTSTNGNVACVVPFEVVTARSSIQIDLQMQIFQPKNQICLNRNQICVLIGESGVC